MSTATEKSLEARLCIAVDDPCALCRRRLNRMVGMTETYLAGTENWVCYGCASSIDPDLANFAYAPERLRKRNRTNFEVDHFGVCPECGRWGRRCLNVGATHWYVCFRHGLRWCVGENLFSGWRDETESDWRANAKVLMRLREIEGYWRPPTRGERMREALQNSLTRIRRTIFGETGDEEPPF